MKKFRYLSGFQVDACQIGTFFQVAMPTGESEIIKLRRSTVLPGDNVFDVERPVEGCLRHATVLATMAGATPHLV